MISNEKEFYTVGYAECGRWQVRKSSVDDPYKYKLIEDLGPELKSAYIEADGDFIYKPGESHTSLITEGFPWLFVITTNGNLYVKRVAAPLETAILLDTNVEQACTCRAWKSKEFDVDVGLLVVYRKEVGAFMRAYYKIDNQYTWDSVQILSAAQVNHVEVRRLNDFRVGVLLDNEVLITDRYYIGGTVKSEVLDVNLNEEFRVLSITSEDGENADLAITSVRLHDNQVFWIRANYPFYSRDNTWDDISITTEVVEGQGIDSYWIEDGYLKIRMLLPITSQLAYMSFQIRALNRIRFERTPQSKPICPQIDIIYEGEPIPYNEHLDITLTSTCTLVFVEPVTYANEYPENLNVTLTNQITCSFVELVNLMNNAEENLGVTLGSSMSPLIFIQEGDTPI